MWSDWRPPRLADPVYASTQPSLPSCSAAGKDHYVGGGVGQGGTGVGTGVQQVYIYTVYICLCSLRGGKCSGQIYQDSL